MSALTESLKVRFDTETRDALARRAAKASRTEGAVVRIAVREYLVREGELEKAAKRD